jgi:hypothetical protein
MLNPFAPAWFSRGNGANQAVSLTSSLHPHEPELLSSNIHNMVAVGLSNVFVSPDQGDNTNTIQDPVQVFVEDVSDEESDFIQGFTHAPGSVVLTERHLANAFPYINVSCSVSSGGSIHGRTYHRALAALAHQACAQHHVGRSHHETNRRSLNGSRNANTGPSAPRSALS